MGLKQWQTTILCIGILFFGREPYAFAVPDFVYSLRNWESYDLDGREFISFTLEPDDLWQKKVTTFPETSRQLAYTSYDQYSQILAEFLADGANTFVHKTFVENYPELGFTFFRKLHAGNVMLDGNSSVVVVGLGDGNGRLVESLASVRIVRRRHGSELTGEIKFGVPVKEPNRTREERIRHGEFLKRNNIATGPFKDLQDWQFSTIELANLAAAPQFRDISMSLLTRAMRKILVSGGHYFTNNIRLVAYDRLVLICSEKLVEYYSRFGLTVIEKHSADVVLMGGTTAAFHDLWVERQSRYPLPRFGEEKLARVLAPLQHNPRASATANVRFILPRIIEPCRLTGDVQVMQDWGVDHSRLLIDF